jgi:hypothetical protein
MIAESALDRAMDKSSAYLIEFSLIDNIAGKPSKLELSPHLKSPGYFINDDCSSSRGSTPDLLFSPFLR